MRSELACDPTFWTLPQVGVSPLHDQRRRRCKYRHVISFWPIISIGCENTNTNMHDIVGVRNPPSRQELDAFCSRMWQKNPPFFVFPCLRNGRRDLNLKKYVFPRVHNLNFRRRAFFGRKIAATATRLISLEFFEPSVTQSSPIDPCDGWCDRI